MAKDQFRTIQPFVIVADMRTGSTMLAHSLNRHPQIRCLGEIFHQQDFTDNQLSEANRHRLPPGKILQHIFRSRKNIKAAGFRAMIFLPEKSRPHWISAWQRLREQKNLKVIYLKRGNKLAWYASVQISQKLNRYHPSQNDPVLKPANRPSLQISPGVFDNWVRRRELLYNRRRKQLRGHPSLEVRYENLTADWKAQFGRIQRFLGVAPKQIPDAKYKQEKRPLNDIV
ncbi:MAG: sulfotransferase, partial [Calditrichia bacterium]